MQESKDDIPSFDGLAADPGIAALLEFDPAERSVKRPGGWTAERQREFVARLAFTGSAARAAQQMGKNICGIEAIYRDRRAASFRGAWDRALEAATKRAAERAAFAGRAPRINVRAPARLTGDYDPDGNVKRAGEIRNEYGRWEDEDSIADRGAGDARPARPQAGPNPPAVPAEHRAPSGQARRV